MNILRSFTETVVTTPTDTFPISFEYDEKYDAVHVFLNDVAVEDLGYTVSQVNAVTLKVEPAIPEGTVRIERETDIDKMKYIFDAGALFIDQNVDADFRQIVHSQQEVRDGFIKLRGDVLPLVHGLQEALQQAQEASEAAQEAADAAEEAAQVSRSADKVFDSSGITQQVINNGVDIPADLLTVPTPKDNSRLFVRSIQCWYTYKPTLTATSNGVTIVGKWEMDVQDAYYASWFCLDSSPSSPKQDEFMLGYTYATTKQRPFIVDIPIYVNSTRKQSGFYNQVHYAVVALSNSVLWFTPNGKLIQVGVVEAAYSILSLYGANNFYIHKPTLEGDRHTATGVVGESGFGLAITGCSNGIIDYPTVNSCRGDNFYIGQEYFNNSATTLIPKNITINKLTSVDAYRNGLALCAGEDIYIDAPHISNVSGTAPEACIDIEPEEGLSVLSYLKNVVVHNATLLNGNSVGVLHWINGSRDVDVKFTGTTSISGCYYVLGCNGSSTDWSSVQCSGGVWYEKLMFDHRITGSTKGVFDVSTPTRGKGIPIYIDTLEIHTLATKVGDSIGFLFDGRYTYSGNFKVNKLTITDHGLPTIVNMVRSQTGNVVLEHVKIPIDPRTKLNHYDGVGTYSCGDYVDIGGYEEVNVANISTAYLLANTQLCTPADDGSGALYNRITTIPNVGRMLTYKLSDNAITVGYGVQTVTPFLEVPRIECTSKGGYVTIDNTGVQPKVSSIFRTWGLGSVVVN
ncbi:tail spike protein [Acinetobacter phage vB_AbaP_APK48-3]|uniref:Tail spike protein n=1 Tax=Acinetobacter phage vB_AbaP_APK48-3 TaxID=2663328 RepID=A0A5Q2W739_9CAUD|nr:tail spike protein [Acinetobacter phage vB_AbaP_APK48-3]